MVQNKLHEVTKKVKTVVSQRKSKVSNVIVNRGNKKTPVIMEVNVSIMKMEM